MLTSDLVVAKVQKNHVRPTFVDAEDEGALSLAETLIQVFEDYRGETRGALFQELGELLGSGTAFLLHRGLAKLLEDRCTFEVVADIEPPELRRDVFARAAMSHQDVEVPFDRNEVLSEFAKEKELAHEALERGLYADLKDEQILETFKECEAQWLLHRYNVALVQALLIRAQSLEVAVVDKNPAYYRALFRTIKFCQLLHTVKDRDEEGCHIKLDGPLSVLKSPQRYGVQMARFFPVLLHAEGWSLRAKVLHGKKRVKKTFELDHQCGLRPIDRLKGAWIPDEIAWFPERFRETTDAWTVTDQTDPIDLGKQGILIPDFSFCHRETGTEIPMEVLGYWRKGAVESRLKDLKRSRLQVLLAISKELHIEEDALPDDWPGVVYVYRRALVPRDLVKVLERLV